MSLVIDYAWSGPSPDQLVAMGAVGVMRYLSHDNSKDLSIPERDALRARQLDIGLVFESIANRAAQGSGAGHDDGTFANAKADQLGYPRDCTIWFAVDFDTSPGVVQPYFDGVGTASPRRTAPYGSFAICEGVRCSGIPWQTVAWSGGKVSTRAGLLQNGFSGSYDRNRTLKDNYGQWLGHTATQEEEEMIMFGCSDHNHNAAILLVTGSLVTVVGNPDDFNSIAAGGVKVANISPPMFDAYVAQIGR